MKIFSILTIALLIIFQSIGFAAVKTFSASGEYLMSDYDTPEIAEEIALDFAKQNAAEQAGIYLESYSRTKDFEIEETEIKTVASSKVEVLTKNITRQPQNNGRVLLRADIKATVDTSELDNFIKQTREQRQAAIQRYKELQAINEKIKQDIAALQKKLSAIKDDVKDDDLLVEQERINREFLSKQKLVEFAVKPFENEQIKYDITKIKHDPMLIDEAIKFNPKNISAYMMKAMFASLSSSAINDINKGFIFTSDPEISAVLHAMRGIQYTKKGDLNRALEEYDKAIQLDPKASAYYVVRASFYESRLKDYDKAIADYAVAITLNPKDIKIYESRGKLYESQERYSEAISDYETILRIAPEKSDTYYEKIGDMYKKLKDYTHALEYYTKAINLEPEQSFADHRVSVYLSRALIYEEQGEYDKAIADCDTGIALSKSSLGKINKTGMDALIKATYTTMISTLESIKQTAFEEKQKEIQEALEEKNFLDKYSNIDLNNIDALIERGNAYLDKYYRKGLKEENLKQALEDYTRVLKLDPKNQLAYQKRGLTYIALKDYKAALADFNALIELNPNYEYVYVSRGYAYEQLGELTKALDDYNKALEFAPNNEHIEENRQRVLEKLYPDRYNVEFFLKEATSFRENKDYARAIKAYTKVLERDSKNQEAYFYRGLMYIYTKKHYLALQDYEKLLELNPDYDQAAYNNRGICYTNTKRYKDALADFDKAILLNPNYAEAYNNRGWAYEQLGKLKEALADYEKSIELYPNSELAKKNRQRVLDKLKK